MSTSTSTTFATPTILHRLLVVMLLLLIVVAASAGAAVTPQATPQDDTTTTTKHSHHHYHLRTPPQASHASLQSQQQQQERSLSFTPFLGCVDDFSFGIPHQQECYAVDSYPCRYADQSGCEEMTATYVYYIGGERRDGGESYPNVLYESIIVSARRNCNGMGTSDCSVSVGHQQCGGCSNTPATYRTITLTDCSGVLNDWGSPIFPTTQQTITVEEGGGHLALARNTSWCAHPAVANRKRLELSGSLTYNMDATSPTQAQNTALVQQTNLFYTDLLATYVTLFQTFVISTWASKFSAGGTQGTLVLEYNATVTLDPTDTTTTIPSLVPIMTDPQAMQLYTIQYVQPINAVYATVTSTTSTAGATP